jgi:hypothetical protein
VSKRLLKVFLCHSSGDKPAVRDLYNRLRSAASYISPWLDEENLLPGQNWQEIIPAEVRKSDVVIICLSQSAINKRGYLQKEIKVALDVADEQPEGTIFLIPVRLEVCELPARLAHLHYVNLFEENGFDRLMRALKSRTEKLDLTLDVRTSSDILESLRARLENDFYISGPRVGQFGKTRIPDEDRHYQESWGELLDEKPNFYLTYWGWQAMLKLLPN